MSQIYNDNTKRPKVQGIQLGILRISAREFTEFAGSSAEGRGSRRERCWRYVSVYEKSPKKWLHLSPKSFRNFTKWFKEGRDWSIVVT